MKPAVSIKEIILRGLQSNLIIISEDLSIITYVNQNISRNYQNPEEKIQAQVFCELVLKYNYPAGQVKQHVKVTVGSDVKEADMIVYKDRECKKPHIIVECKKEAISELEFGQAVRQAYAYAYATAGTVKYIWVTSGIKNEYYAFDRELDSRESVTDIPQYKVKELANYKFAKNGGTTKEGQKLFPLEKVEESELTNCFKQAHQALWGGGELNPSEAFDELDKLIFCKIIDEKKKRGNGQPYDFQIIKAEPKSKDKRDIEIADLETSNQLLERLKLLYEEGKMIGERKNDTEIFREGIKLNAAKARMVVGYLEGIDLLHTDLDSKGRAFETFMGSFFRGNFGQYFTPRPIVRFIVDSLPIDENHRVLDTSCGSGGFLLHALDKVRKAARNFYNIKDGEQESLECYTQWHDFAQFNLYGIEINEQIARTAKMNMIVHDDGHTNVVTSDGLLLPENLRAKTNNDGFRENSFDYILTNPPFGSTVKQTEKAYLHQYKLATKEVDWLNPNSKAAGRPSQSTEVLFIEQAENYLTDGGYLAIVIPDGILTNSSMQYVRDYISDTFRIVAVISMPQTAFAANGAGVKSSVLFLKKYSSDEKLLRMKCRENIKKNLMENSEDGKKLSILFKDKKDSIATINRQIKDKERNENPEAVKQLLSKKQDVLEEFDEKIETTREHLSEAYYLQYKNALADYPIFMAIAKEIGYDASGKETGKNELPEISKELGKFILAIEEGKDCFFLLSPKFDENKVFIRTWGKLESRLDSNYYKQIYMDLEEAVAKKTNYKLRDFIRQMASGVTPKITEYEKYYTDCENGVPFLRVQNLSPEGLNWADCRYINRKTHDGMLKRSQVFSGDLLVKITGVGRMAITSVAPEGFEGNINQHIVVIKTKKPELNEQIAAFLNSEIGEMLAARRSTGGTRPALDYAALRSIPVILDHTISEVMQQAYEKKKEKEKEAQLLLDRTNEELLLELGIALPPNDNDSLENRMFYVKSNEVFFSRYDASFHKPVFAANAHNLQNGKYPAAPLKKTAPVGLIKGILPKNDQKGGSCKVIQIGNIKADGTIDTIETMTAQPIYSLEHKLEKGDVLVVVTGATIGKIGFWDCEDEFYLGGDIVKFNTENDCLNEIYAFLLRTKPYQMQIKKSITGATNGHLAVKDIEQLPLPYQMDENVQKTIAENLSSVRQKINTLKQEAKAEVHCAQAKVGKILLGK